jgi:ActR/RegA family two-component response regulator
MNARPAPRRLLLVDDDLLVLRSVGRLLRGRGFIVESAASVAAALEQLAAADFDVVVTELRLGDGTGLDLLEGAGGRVDARRAVLMADPLPTLPSGIRTVSKDQPATDLIDAVNAVCGDQISCAA